VTERSRYTATTGRETGAAIVPGFDTNPYKAAQRNGGYLFTEEEQYLIETGSRHEYVYTGEETDQNSLIQYLRKPIVYLKPRYDRDARRWIDNENPIRTEIVDRTNEYLKRVEFIDLHKLPTFILIPKQVDAQTGTICIEAFTMLKNEGFLVFYTMVAGAGKLVCIPPPAEDQSDQGLDEHIDKINLLMGQLSHFFVIGAGAGVHGSDLHASGIMISNDLMEVFPDGQRGKRNFDSGMPPTIAAARDANRKMAEYKDGADIDFHIRPHEYQVEYWAPVNPHTEPPDGYETFTAKKVTHVKLSHREIRDLYRGVDHHHFVRNIQPRVSYDLSAESFDPHDVTGWIHDEVDTRDSGFFAAGAPTTVNLRRMAVSISAMRAIKDRKSRRLYEFIERNKEMLPPEVAMYRHTIFHTTTGESMTMIYRNPFQRYPTGLIGRNGQPLTEEQRQMNEVLNTFDRHQFEEISGWEADAMDNILVAEFNLGVQHSTVDLPQAKVYDFRLFMQHIYFPDPGDKQEFMKRAQRYADISKAMRAASVDAPVRTGNEGREMALFAPRPYNYKSNSGSSANV
jgi:hypothetical protein